MRIYKFILLFVSLLLLTGCWDAIELEEQAYVVAVGVDKGDDEFLSITFQIANPQKGSSQISESQNEPPFTLITIKAPDRASAKDLANISVSRRINFSNLKIFIISEEFARSDHFKEYIESLMRDPKISREINIMVTKEKAEDFIKNNKPPLETRPHKNYDFMTERYKDTGLVTLSTVNRLLKKVNENRCAFTAIYATATELKPVSPKLDDDYYPGQVPKEGDNPAQMIGTAVIGRMKMIGTLTGAETRLMLNMWPNAKAKNWIQTFPDPLVKDKHITARILKKETPEIKVNSKGNLKIQVTVRLNLEIITISSYKNYVTDTKKQKLLIDSIEKHYETESYKLIKKSQEELKADIFNWAYIARKNFKTLKDLDKYNWKEKYPNAKVTVKYDITVKQFGKDLQPPKVNELED